MPALTLRATKGSPLTHDELDGNFSYFQALFNGLGSMSSQSAGAVSITGGSITGLSTLSVHGFMSSLGWVAQQNQTVYSVINGPGFGPELRCRWDGATSDRWYDFGYHSNTGEFYSILKLLPDQTYKLQLNGGGYFAGSIKTESSLIFSNGQSLYAHGEHVGVSNWIRFSGHYGLYCPDVNGAHFYPNGVSSYGAWRVIGARNGWGGIAFAAWANDLHLMVGQSGSAVGFHREGYGWNLLIENGQGYIGRNTGGGGTNARIMCNDEVWDDWSSFAPSITSDSWTGPSAYQRREGRFLRVGKLMYCRINLQWSGMSGSGRLIISDLPVNVKSSIVAGNLADTPIFSHIDSSLGTGQLSMIFDGGDRNHIMFREAAWVGLNDGNRLSWSPDGWIAGDFIYPIN